MFRAEVCGRGRPPTVRRAREMLEIDSGHESDQETGESRSFFFCVTVGDRWAGRYRGMLVERWIHHIVCFFFLPRIVFFFHYVIACCLF